MPFEKCPSCGSYTLDIDLAREALVCFSCGYSEGVNSEYMEIHNGIYVLSRPSISKREEIEKIILELDLKGTFNSANKLNPSLRDSVINEIKYRIWNAKREIYRLERILKLFK